MSRGLVFQPEKVQRPDRPLVRAGAGGDDRTGRVYVYHQEDIALAVNVALATQRPLLLSGPSGSGKSSLALNVALSLGWRYYEYVVTARSEARDLLWSLDTLRRLNDAQAREKELRPDQSYVEPGVLWWAFDRTSAVWRGKQGGIPSQECVPDPSLTGGDEAVVLIDEIDKADPDLPNNLLVPLGSLEFYVEPLRLRVEGRRPPLIFITTNRERELPKAFLRRCVTLHLPAPNTEQLVEIAQAVIPEVDADEKLFRQVAEHVVEVASHDDAEGSVSTAEYLDTIKACVALQIEPGSARFASLSRITLEKRTAGGER